jgi:hypothetical protein
MILIAASLYLPQHIAFLTSRAWFYYHGDETTKSVMDSAAAVTTQAAMGILESEGLTLAGKLQGTAEAQAREL